MNHTSVISGTFQEAGAQASLHSHGFWFFFLCWLHVCVPKLIRVGDAQWEKIAGISVCSWNFTCVGHRNIHSSNIYWMHIMHQAYWHGETDESLSFPPGTHSLGGRGGGRETGKETPVEPSQVPTVPCADAWRYQADSRHIEMISFHCEYSWTLLTFYVCTCSFILRCELK